MVALLTFLRREPDGSHVLVTPAEKLAIESKRPPFTAIEMSKEGEGQQRATRPSASIPGTPSCRSRTSARFDDTRRPGPLISMSAPGSRRSRAHVYYEFAEIALANGSAPPGVWSNGAFFPLEPDDACRPPPRRAGRTATADLLAGDDMIRADVALTRSRPRC